MLHRRFYLLGCPIEAFGKTPGILLAVYDDPAVAVGDLKATRGENPPPTIVYWIQEGWSGDPKTYALRPFGEQTVADTGLRIIHRDPGQLSTVVLTDEQYAAFETVRATLADICAKDSDMLSTGAQMMATAMESFRVSFIEPRPS